MKPEKNQPSNSKLKLPINVDTVAIALGLGLAALVRFNVIHHISF